MKATRTIRSNETNQPCKPRYIAALMVILLLSGCASTPKISQSPTHSLSRLVDYALRLQGAPYAYGKASPQEGFDCSGFVWYVFHHHGLSIPRTTEQMALTLPAVDFDERRPGDLLFFHTGDKLFSHVALYLGSETFIHAPSSSTGRVMVSGLDRRYWQQRLVGVRRPLLLDRFVSQTKNGQDEI